ncbi:peroxidase 57-like [Typha angustifolia]|uniref:peroxidase 57-like n=1 Tax=Typha angustifolia TaxID=59011 RepID=UPI003C2D8063
MAILSLVLLLLAHIITTSFSLQIHFYSKSCPRAEIIVKQVVQKHFQQDPSVPSGLLRLQFHDCFVRGCDGSILLDSDGHNVAEKNAPPNLTLRTFDVIDDIKAELEKECRGVVSCADILALATRDGVKLSGGAAYALPTGRRDGVVSNVADVHLPSPMISVAEAVAAFLSINLDIVDLTTLLGAHSIGLCHCGFFMDRLYNHKGTGLPDPSIDPTLLTTLLKKCPPHAVTLQNITQDSSVFMNQATTTPFLLDGSSFYHGVLNGMAVLQLDQELAFTDLTNKLAARFVNSPKLFRKQFSKSMVKLGNVGVLTGEEGEVRLNCRRVNSATSSNSSTKV